MPDTLPAPGEVGFLSFVCQVADVLIAITGQRAIHSHQGLRDGRRNAWRRVVGLQSQEEEFRDFQMDVENQRREPYQNVDELADRLVRNNEVPPDRKSVV